MAVEQANPGRSTGYRLRVVAARAVVTFERLWLALWPAMAVLAVFLTVSLLGWWELLPVWLHGVGLLLFIGAFVTALWRAREAFGLAGNDAGLARLEQDSGVPYRALRALQDRLPDGVSNPATVALWQAHRRRLQGLVGQLRLSAPRSGLPRRDPWALRALLLLILCVALIDARGQIGERLWHAVVPTTAAAVPGPAMQAQLWVTPPAYTRRPPLGAEQTSATDRLIVPAGSEILAQLHHVPPELAQAVARLVTPAGEQAMGDMGQGSAEARTVLQQPGRLAILAPDGAELASWSVEVLSDHAPTIRFADDPKVTHRGALRIGFEATDDYGVAEVALEVAPQARADETERLPLLKPTSQPGTITSAAYADLVAHPFAGLPVVMRLEAIDGIGQTGRSGPLEIKLPERQFRHPLARAVIEQRKALVATPDKRENIAGRLAALAETPVAGQLGVTVPLSLRIAALRARAAETRELRRHVVDLLWEIALYIEDGALSTAERDLRALQERLQQALQDNATDAELEQLMRELEQALDRFLEEMMRQALEQAERGDMQQPMQPVDPSQLVERQDLQRMLDRARELMRSGQREQARQLLSQLREMLENMQTAMGQMRPSQEQQALSDLQKMIQLQQNLMDRSFQMERQQQGQQGQRGRRGQQQGQRGQQGQQGQQGQRGQQQGQRMPGDGNAENGTADSTGRAAAEQEGLRRALGELMRRMGEAGMSIPRSLGQAELQMRGARDSLEQGDPGQASGQQAQALDLMQQGGQAMLEQMQQQMFGQQGFGPGGEPIIQGRRARDPLGRSQFNDGGHDPTGALVPEEADLGRAREVLEELYRRSGERHRAPTELDYYKRLLDRF